MIYIVVFMSSIFFAWLAERSKDKGIIVLCSVISILIPSILGGLRAHGMGIDTVTYGLPHALNALKSPDFAYFMSHGSKAEPLYKTIVFFTMKTLEHVNWCYFFYQLITMSCFYIGAYKHRKIAPLPLTILMYLLIYYQYIYSAIRQGMAAAIVFMGLDTVEKKQYGKFLIYVGVATMFHYSSLVAIFFILGMHMLTVSKNFVKHEYSKIMIITTVALLLYFVRPLMSFIINFVPFLMKYENYFHNDYNEQSAQNSMMAVFCCELIMFLLYGKGAAKIFSGGNNTENNVNFFKFNIIFVVFFQLAVQFFKRVLLYSEFANLIALSAIPNFVKEKNLKFLVTFAVILGAVLYCVKRFVIWGFYQTWPYRSILD